MKKRVWRGWVGIGFNGDIWLGTIAFNREACSERIDESGAYLSAIPVTITESKPPVKRKGRK